MAVIQKLLNNNAIQSPRRELLEKHQHIAGCGSIYRSGFGYGVLEDD
jgi:hypothetical protein